MSNRVFYNECIHKALAIALWDIGSLFSKAEGVGIAAYVQEMSLTN